MKKLLITAHHQFISKNIIFSGVVDALIAHGFQVYIAVPELKHEYFKTALKSKKITPVVIKRAGFVSKLDAIFRRIFITLQSSHYWEYKRKEITPGVRSELYAKVTKYVNLKFFPTQLLIRILRWLFNLIPISVDPVTRKIINEMDVVLLTDIYLEEDITIGKIAKKLDKLTVGMVRSWDNCYSKGILRILPDFCLVNNNVIKNELSSMHSYPRNRIEVVGMPQFDGFINNKRTCRAEFFNKLGIPENKKLILFAPAGKILSDTDSDICEMLNDIANDSLHEENLHVLVRNHPGHPADLNKCDSFKNFTIQTPGTKFDTIDKYSELTQLEQDYLADLLYHSSIVIYVATTLGVDSLVFDKPQIVINFDGYKEKSYFESVKRYHDEQHMEQYLNSGVASVVDSKLQLLSEIEKYIKNPTYKSLERDKEKERQITNYLGSSVDKLSTSLIDIVSEKI